jgi:hypothetical protein
MGIYEHCGQVGGRVQLRELLTDGVFACHSSSGYLGKAGERWYVRRRPPIISRNFAGDGRSSLAVFQHRPGPA